MSKKRGGDRGRRGRHPDRDPDGSALLSSLERTGLRTKEALAAWLPGRLPRVALEAIADGDPLEIEALARRIIESGAWLLDVERLVTRGMATVAFAAHRYNGFPEVDRWVARELDKALEACLDEDREHVLEGLGVDAESAPNFHWLAQVLGLELDQVVPATVAFNALPQAVRRAWYALGVQGKTVEQCVESGLGSASEIRARANRATLTLSLLEDPGGGQP